MMRRLTLILLIPFLFACEESDSPETNSDNFDRSAMLVNWADNIIIPSYDRYLSDVKNLKASKDAFIANPEANSFAKLREDWLTAYTSWQSVSMFEIGPAEEIALRDYINIYPSNVQNIEEAISTGVYNFELPSSRDMQGFPALDYLLFIMKDDVESTIGKLGQTGYSNYLSDVVDRIHTLSEVVVNKWKDSYRDTFVGNIGSEANSSVNKMANDYVYYYEKELRAGKIGIPAGIFSSSVRPDLVEAPHSRIYSKQLCIASLTAVRDFYKGKSVNSNQEGESLYSYLKYLNSISQDNNLSDQILNQFNVSIEKVEGLNDDFYAEVENNNTAMLEAYDNIQSNVILMKVDMFQAMNIRVDYVDADGD